MSKIKCSCMKMHVCIAFTFTVLAVAYAAQNLGPTPVIRTSLGPVVGKRVRTDKGNEYFAFLSVPFAEEPVRFGKPRRRTPWTRVENVSEYRNVCMQHYFGPDVAVINPSEDCLSMKILTPATVGAPNSNYYPSGSSSNLFPIIYWPSGGGFFIGASTFGEDNQADTWVTQGVIFVQGNYRKNAYGFWSSGTNDAPGNYAFWDMLEGLKFIRDNARAFGGDPNRIVIGGQGAGGVAAEGLSLSPLTRGLWVGLILQSATVFHPDVNLDPNMQLQRYRNVSIAVGCDDSRGRSWDSGQRRQIVECMKSMDPERVLKAQEDIGVSTLFYGPRVDGPGGFFPESFEELAKKRPNTPVIIGTTKNEYAWDLVVFPSAKAQRLQVPQTSTKTVEEICSNVVSRDTWPRTFSLLRYGCVENYLTRPGFPPPGDNNWYLQQAIKAGSDARYNGPAMKDVHFMTENNNTQVYLYSFDYSRPKAGEWWRQAGAFHNWDIFFTEDFVVGPYGFPKGPQEERITQMWSEFNTNLMKFGTPTPRGRRSTANVEWRPVHVPSGYNYLSFDLRPQNKDYFHSPDVQFWTQYADDLRKIALGANNRFG